jgi:hypothetical protein
MRPNEWLQPDRFIVNDKQNKLTKREHSELSSSEELELIKKIIKFKKHLRKSRF